VWITRKRKTTRVWPSPVKGVEYYSLEDLRKALKDLGYSSTDQIVDKVRQRVSVRDDGRYNLDELKQAAREIYSQPDWQAEKLDKTAVQARKNRVFAAHNGK
jgi:hypothetical protein